ncbi:uncharacterized protein FA14DRAFT_61959 [Meira miltonrushii]|uniref:Uncharacterized protein n=1 Tax=Meira miltonrushii TaxID=1280837 RepID=A0A316VCY8_9BASI|nr:uncharacterized protein FA14DRAFT_61959 [Meira miltonrushii]PWN33415.1 hypothetical protein FA14DRAFT_61959 [Meira miltonrushii]
MKASTPKHSSRSVARNTLFINQNDAAYWLAAENFVDDDDMIASVRKSPPQQVSPSKKQALGQKSTQGLNSAQDKPVVLGLSQLRPKKSGLFAAVAPHSPMRSTNDSKLLSVQNSKAADCTAPSTCLNTPTGEHSFSYPRRAPPAPNMTAQAKGNDPKSPLSPVSPLPPSLSSSLLPPVDIKSLSIDPSSPQHSSSAFLTSSPIFHSPRHGHASTQTISSSNSHATALVGTAMLASFPSPPQREERARMIDYNEMKRRAMESREEKQTDRAFVRHQSKPLPPAPFLKTHDLEYDTDSEDEESTRTSSDLHGWSASQAGMPAAIAQHRPLCPYAEHSDVSTDHCGCQSVVSQKFYQSNNNKLACSSAPDLLDLVASAGQTEEQRRNEDIQRAKNVLYRLSDEINKLEAEGNQPNKPSAPKKTAIRWALPKDPKRDAELQYQSGLLSAPVNKSLPTKPDEKELQRSLTPDPSRPIQGQLWPQSHAMVERSVTPGPSYGLAAGMLHACLAPRSPSSSVDLARPIEPPVIKSILRPQRSFDMLKHNRSESTLPSASAPRAVTPSPPFAAQRRMISTLRSQDRWNSNGSNPSGKRNGSPTNAKPSSPPSRTHQWDSPWQNVRSQAATKASEASRHHRQNSSKSSTSSANSAMTSSHGSSNTHSSTADSNGPTTPIWAKLQYKGRPSMGVIHESNKATVNSDGYSTVPVSPASTQSPQTPTSVRAPISPRRRKDDTAYLVNAIEPFPLEQRHVPRKSSTAPPPLPPPLPAGHRLLDGRAIEANLKANRGATYTHFGPPPRMASRSNTDENGSYGFAL